MSAPRWMRALARPGARLAAPGEVEARAVILPAGDRRRRPTARIAAARFHAARTRIRPSAIARWRRVR